MVHSVSEAAKAGGLRILRTVTEPSAAAYACMFRNLIAMNEDEKLIPDGLDGGTFEVTVITDREVRIDVIVNEGNISLGEKNIDVSFYD